jgi:hypothetical protein
VVSCGTRLLLMPLLLRRLVTLLLLRLLFKPNTAEWGRLVGTVASCNTRVIQLTII